jgi:hypothetical protein
MGRLNRRAIYVVSLDNTNDIIMKLTTVALASGFVLFTSLALASTDHHRTFARAQRGNVGKVHLHRNYGNPDGPATLSGSGKSYAVPGWTDEQTQYWIDNATGPKD